MTTPDLKEIINRFLLKPESDVDRPFLCKPNKLPDGRILATDGHAMIVFDSLQLDDDELYKYAFDEKWQPRFGKALEGIDKIETYSPLPKYPKCNSLKCAGKGYIEITETESPECPLCDGSGEHECSCGDVHDCSKCGGTGTRNEIGKPVTKKERCNCYVEFDNRRVARRYANLIADLPGVQWGVADDNKEGGVFFKFDGGVGILMPLRY